MRFFRFLIVFLFCISCFSQSYAGSRKVRLGAFASAICASALSGCGTFQYSDQFFCVGKPETPAHAPDANWQNPLVENLGPLEKMYSGVVNIRAGLEDIGVGMGFFISPTFIVTAKHVLQHESSLLDNPALLREFKGSIVEIFFSDEDFSLGEHNSVTFTVEHHDRPRVKAIYLDESRDLAWIELEAPLTCHEHLPLQIAQEAPPERNSNLFALTRNPFQSDIRAYFRHMQSLHPTHGESIQRLWYAHAPWISSRFLYHAYPWTNQDIVAPGDSGGPVLNDRGEVVGVAVWAWPPLDPNQEFHIEPLIGGETFPESVDNTGPVH